MARMTDEEADYWDEYYTRTYGSQNPPKVSGDGKSGFFMKHKGSVVILDNLSASYLHARSESSNKTPSEIIGELVRKELKAAM
ncbi:hypothetical protein FACS189479_04090 [Spirochaetia bacterium]|nr:hypothetical protein FACS189479_04090 [Spirochaetia bacterium]